MADDSTLKLLIQLGVIGKEDAEAARDLLGEIATVEKHSAVTKGELKAATDAAGVSQEELSKSIKQGADHLEAFNLHGKDAHKLIHSLNELTPGLGTALKLAFNPASIGIVAALVGVQQFAKYLEGIRQTAEAMNELRFAEIFGAPEEWDAAKTSYNELAEAMAKIATAQKSIKDDTDIIIAQQKEQLQNARAIAQAELDAKNARLGTSDKLSDSKLPELEIELAARQAERDRTRQAQISGVTDTGTGAAKNKADAAVGNAQNEIADLQTRIAERAKAIPLLKGQEKEDQTGLLDKENKRLLQLQGNMPDLLANQKRAQDADAAAAAATQNLAKRMQELDAEIARLQRSITGAKDTEFQIAGIKGLAAERAGDKASVDAAAERVKTAGAGKDALIINALDWLAGHQERTHAQTQNVVAQIMRRLNQLEAQGQQQRNRPGG